jgi:hypothetical protein
VDPHAEVTWTDGWILCCIAMARADGATLRGLIGTADHVGSAIPSLDEINRTVSRLEAAGLVHIRRGRLHAAAAPERLLQRHRKLGARIVCGHFVDFVPGLHLPPDPPLVSATRSAYTQNEYATALKAYRRTTRDAMRRLFLGAGRAFPRRATT